MHAVGDADKAPQSGPRESAGDQEQAPASQRGDFGFGALKELKRLEAAASDAQAATKADPSNESLKLRAETAEMRRDLFLLDHDQAGAFKFNRFGRDLVKMFEAGPDKQPLIEVDAETGKLTLSESEKGRQLIFVNMGELDRVNKEGGGHAAGDAALKETVRAIETAVLTTFGADAKNVDYSMLRYSGNEYMVTLNGATAEQQKTFQEAIKTHWQDMDERVREQKLAEIGISESPPFTVNGVAFAEVADIMSEMQLELSADQRVSQDDPAGAAREMIDVLRLRANYGLDVDKFVDRTKRVREVQNSDRPAVEKAAFFETYMKKMFPEGMADAAFVAAMTDEEAEQAGFEYAENYLKGAADRSAAKDAIIAKRLEEIRASRGTAESPHEVASPTGAKLADIPEKTKGHMALDAARAKAEAARATNDPDRIAHAEALRDIEVASRESGTGLLTRNKHYNDLEAAFRENRMVSQVFIDMGFLKLFDKAGGSDVGDKALKQAANLIEQALAASGLEGRAYRYAGDEFTVQLEGDVTKAKEFRTMLDTMVREAGAIPVGKLGAKEYQPTELVFNCGEADTSMAESVYADLLAAGVYDERDLGDADRVLNEKAHLMTVIADKGIEKDKAVDRFLLLVKSLRDPAYKTDPARKQQVDGIRKYSQKAIYVERGGAQMLDALIASPGTPEEERAEIEAFVEQRMAEAPEQKNRKNQLINKLIELHGKINFYKAAKEKASADKAESAAEVERLHQQLEVAQRERQALIDVRNALKQ